MSEPGTYRDLGESAWRWVCAQIRDDDGPWLPDAVTDEAPAGPAYDRDSVYAGIGGLGPVLAEIAQYRPLTVADRDFAGAVQAWLAATVPERREPSLYIQEPPVTRRVPREPGRVGQQRTEPLHPSVDGDVVDLDAALGESSSTSRYDRA